ncbi:hypothetical protein COCOBI_18-3000 [Coccomyxa sp. Obi]|nr:hypothetical protein COCOBI_18-3000 [Coccomyxa sp. Obi]
MDSCASSPTAQRTFRWHHRAVNSSRVSFGSRPRSQSLSTPDVVLTLTVASRQSPRMAFLQEDRSLAATTPADSAAPVWCRVRWPQQRASREEASTLSCAGHGRDGKWRSLARREPREAGALVPRRQHRLCLASSAVAASEEPVLKAVDGGDRAKAVAASVEGSSMLHGRMDLALRDAVCPSSAEKRLFLLLWRPSVPR